MRAFSFSLQKVLDARETLERVVEEKMARAAVELERNEQELTRQRARLKRETNRVEQLRGIDMPVRDLRGHIACLDRAERGVEEQSDRVRQGNLKVEEVRRELVEVLKERKSLERLRDRERRQWQIESRRMERLEMDEIASAGFVRRQRA